MDDEILNDTNESLPLGYSASILNFSQNAENSTKNNGSPVSSKSAGSSLLDYYRYNGTPSSLHVHSKFSFQNLKSKRRSNRKSSNLNNKENVSCSSQKVTAETNDNESQTICVDDSYESCDSLARSLHGLDKNNSEEMSPVATPRIADVQNNIRKKRTKAPKQLCQSKSRELDWTIITENTEKNSIKSDKTTSKKNRKSNDRASHLDLQISTNGDSVGSGVDIVDEISTSKTPSKQKVISTSRKKGFSTFIQKKTPCLIDELAASYEENSEIQKHELKSAEVISIESTRKLLSHANEDSLDIKLEASDSQDKKPAAISKQIMKWAIIFSQGGICIEGYTRLGCGDQTLFRSSLIHEIQNSGRTLVTASGSKYELVGEMLIQASLDAGVPINIVKRFVNGFPSGWHSYYCKRYAELNRSDSGSYQDDKNVSGGQDISHQICLTARNKSNVYQRLHLSSVSEDTKTSVLSTKILSDVKPNHKSLTPRPPVSTNLTSKPRTRRTIHTMSTTPPEIGTLCKTRSMGLLQPNISAISYKDDSREKRELSCPKVTQDRTGEGKKISEKISETATQPVNRRTRKSRATSKEKPRKRSSVKALYNTPDPKQKQPNKSVEKSLKTDKTQILLSYINSIENVIKTATLSEAISEKITKNPAKVNKKKEGYTKKAVRTLPKCSVVKEAGNCVNRLKDSDKQEDMTRNKARIDKERISPLRLRNRNYKVPITPLIIENVAEKFKVSIPSDLLQQKSEINEVPSKSKKRKRENGEIARAKKRPKKGRKPQPNDVMDSQRENSNSKKVSSKKNSLEGGSGHGNANPISGKSEEQNCKKWTKYQRSKLNKLVGRDSTWDEISIQMKFSAEECETVYYEMFRKKRRKTTVKENVDTGPVEVTARRGTLKHRKQVRQNLEVLKRPKPEFQDLFSSEGPTQDVNYGDNIFSADLFTIPDAENAILPFTPNTRPPVDIDAIVVTPAWFKTPTGDNNAFDESGWTPMMEAQTPAELKEIFLPEQELFRDMGLKRKEADRVIVQMQKKMMRGTLREYDRNKNKKLQKSGENKLKKFSPEIDFNLFKNTEQNEHSSEDENDKDEYFDCE